jgi:hypothetical protein
MPSPALLPAAVLVLTLAGCSSPPREPGIPLGTESFLMTVSVDTVPIIAQERVRMKLVVRDRETKQPVQNGEGRIFASKDGVKTYDGLAKGEGVGTYYANLFFAVSGEWAFGVEFHADSTKRLERDNWSMTVAPPKPGVQ